MTHDANRSIWTTRLALTALILLMTTGCESLGIKRPKIPAAPPDLATLPAPPTPAQLDQKISARRKEILEISKPPASATGLTAAELEREIEKRQNRVKFLDAEVKALLQQRKASEIYYQNTDLQQGPLVSSTPAMTADEPPKVTVVDQQIQLRRSWLDWFRASTPAAPAHDSRTPEDLEREIKQREVRVAFLRSEIEALLLQRKASEIYYQQKKEPQ